MKVRATLEWKAANIAKMRYVCGFKFVAVILSCGRAVCPASIDLVTIHTLNTKCRSRLCLEHGANGLSRGTAPMRPEPFMHKAVKHGMWNKRRAYRTQLAGRNHSANPRYKQDLCDFYMRDGYCKHGYNRSFAHGHGEIRKSPLGGRCDGHYTARMA